MSVIELYQRAFAEHGDTPSAVFFPRGRQGLRWQALAGHIPRCSNGELLDYGCGLAHMRPWLMREHPQVAYAGADMVPEFVAQCRSKYPDCRFHEVSSPDRLADLYQYTVASGIFNIRYVDSDVRHWALVQKIIRQLWQKTTCTMSVDFMHTMVDYRQPTAYHQDPGEFISFAKRELSPLLKLDFSYLPYEFSATIIRQG